jgi:hypothetical protein
MLRLPLLVLAALALLGLAACGGGDGERSATGVILSVDAPSLTQLDSFTLRTNGGDTLEFRIAPGATQDPVTGFVPGHLRSHATLGDQVEVFYREEDGVLLAGRLEDRGRR